MIVFILDLKNGIQVKDENDYKNQHVEGKGSY